MQAVRVGDGGGAAFDHARRTRCEPTSLAVPHARKCLIGGFGSLLWEFFVVGREWKRERLCGFCNLHRIFMLELERSSQLVAHADASDRRK